MHSSRRQFLAQTAALSSGLFLSRISPAFESPLVRLPANTIVIDGNLVPPLEDDKPLDAATKLAVKSSRLTALKATIGGSVGDFAQANAMIDGYDTGIRLNPDTYMKIESAADIYTAQQRSLVGIIYSFEGVEMLESNIDRIDHFRARGVRVMQLSYNQPSAFASGVLAPQPSKGLTALGREAVHRMNALGVSLDLSHCDEPSTLDALSAAAKPPLITHAGCAEVLAHPRNKSDRVLRALAAKGGVVGIYELSFLVPSPRQPTLDDYLKHVVHALNTCGEEHVGIGSDALLMPFDTSAESMAEWNKDIAARKASGVSAPGEGPPPFVIGLNRPDRYEVIADALAKRGYKQSTVDKILGRNFLRIYSQTWETPHKKGKQDGNRMA
jgi:membrane dipeptidase